LLAELTDVLSDGVSQDLWLLSVGIDNNTCGQYQRLMVREITTRSVPRSYAGYPRLSQSIVAL